MKKNNKRKTKNPNVHIPIHEHKHPRRKESTQIQIFSHTISLNIHHCFNNTFYEFKVLKKVITAKMFNINFHNEFIEFGLFCFFYFSSYIYIYIYIYAPPWGLSSLAKELPAAASVMQSSSNELSTLVADRVLKKCKQRLLLLFLKIKIS